MTDNAPALTFDPRQEEAINACIDMENRLVAVSGEAGTGKTTIIRTVCERLTARGINFALAAPTGKAARRVREATGFPAITIHKLLEFNRPDMDENTGESLSASIPNRTASNPLDEEVIIVDEYAMVGTGLHRDLVAAVGRGKLRLFGDIRQLPPIENEKLADPTSPFNACLKMRNSFILDRVFRQEEGNGILEAARAINRGNIFASNPDVSIISNPAMVMKLYEHVRKDPAFWASLNNQIISPARKSDVGTVQLNAVLQTIINPDKPMATLLPRVKWEAKNTVVVALNDKVVCNTNTYDLRDYNDRYEEWEDDITPMLHSFIPPPETKQILNGEIGRIVNIGVDGTLEIDLGDRCVEIPPEITEYNHKRRLLYKADHRRSIELAYALTTHKCQGSEYETIAYVMASAAFYNLSRQNFYTALTRARSKALIFTDQRALGASLRNVKRV